MKECSGKVQKIKVVYYHGVSVANEDDNLSLCGMLAWLYWVVESISVFRPSITVLRDGSKGFVGGLFFRS